MHDVRGRAGAQVRRRTADDFVHQLSNGTWFVGDYLRGQGVTAMYLCTDGHERTARAISLGGAGLYRLKASAKRAAQRWIEIALDDIEALRAQSVTRPKKREG